MRLALREEYTTQGDPNSAPTGSCADGVTAKRVRSGRRRLFSRPLKTQEEEKKKLAEHLAKMFDIMVKLIAVCTAQPWLVAVIDLVGGLSEMAIKASVLGKDYDAKADHRDGGAFHIATDAVFMGISGAGSVGNKALAEGLDAAKAAEQLAKQQVEGLTEKEAAKIITDLGHQAAGAEGSTAVHEAIDAGKTVGKDAAEGAETVSATELKKQAEEAAEHQAEIAEKEKAVKEAEEKAKEAAERQAEIAEKQTAVKEAEETTEKAAKKLDAGKKLTDKGAEFAKSTIITVGGGAIDGDSNQDIGIKWLRSTLGMFVPDMLGEKAEKLIGGTAGKVVGAATETTAGVVAGGDYSKATCSEGAAGYAADKLRDHAAEKYDNEATKDALPTPKPSDAPAALPADMPAAAKMVAPGEKTVAEPAATKPAEPAVAPEPAKPVAPEATKPTEPAAVNPADAVMIAVPAPAPPAPGAAPGLRSGLQGSFLRRRRARPHHRREAEEGASGRRWQRGHRRCRAQVRRGFRGRRQGPRKG